MDIKITLPPISVGNASDEEIRVPFDSQEKVFPAGEVVPLYGHEDYPRKFPGGPLVPSESTALDANGRRVSQHGEKVPKQGAGPKEIAEFCLREAGPLGLYHVTGNRELDEKIRANAAAIADATRLKTHTKTMSDWRQFCRQEGNAGRSIPPMPDTVEKADKWLLAYQNRNKAKIAATTKRFQIKLDGASYNTLDEAKEHIQLRYVEFRENWKDHVVDKLGDDVVAEPEADKPKDEKKKK